MKNYLVSACLVVSSVFLLTNCGKDDNNTTTPPAAVDFIPLTNGTNWTYLSTEGTGSPDTVKLTVTNRDTTANSKTYKIITTTFGANNYMANVGSDHYRLASFPTIGTFEDLYLKDDKAMNDTWTSTANFTYSGLPLSAALTYTIKDKGMPRTANSKSYTNVTHVRLDIVINGIGGVGGGDFYYAKGIGMIESAIVVTPPAIFGVPAYTTSQVLASYEIK